MQYALRNDFNKAPPNLMHIDINSCFATVEQQYNKNLRYKPVVVAPNYGDHGAIVAASREAKPLGIKTGMKIFEAKRICPNLVVLPPHFEKYQKVHNDLKKLLQSYSSIVIPKSIDEFVVDLNQSPQIFSMSNIEISEEIKRRICSEVGEWITVSIGLGPNRFLAKTGAGIKKPDGLDVISHENYMVIYKSLKLTDLCGINTGNLLRLNKIGVHTVESFYYTGFHKLSSAFKSLGAYNWYMKLRGWEVDDYETNRSTMSHSYILRENIDKFESLKPIISKLSVELGERLKFNKLISQGISIFILFNDRTYIKDSKIVEEGIFDGVEIYKIIIKLIYPHKKEARVKKIDITCFNLKEKSLLQLELFDNTLTRMSLSDSVEEINEKFGQNKIIPAIIHGKIESYVKDTSAFTRSNK